MTKPSRSKALLYVSNVIVVFYIAPGLPGETKIPPASRGLYHQPPKGVLLQVRRHLGATQFADGREGGAQADGVAPVGAGNEHATRRLHHLPLADDRGHGVAVGDGLGEDGHVRRDAQIFLYAAQADAEAR